MRDPGVILGIEILVKSASQRGIEELQTSADPEDRLFEPQRFPDNKQFQLVALFAYLFQLRKRLFPVDGR